MRLGVVFGSAALIALAACGNDNPVTPGTNGNVLTAVVDGAAFVPTSITATRTSTRIFIVGANASRTLTIALPMPAGPGVVQLAAGTPNSNVLIAEGTPPNNPVWSSSDFPPDSTTVNNRVVFATISTTEATGTFQFTAGPAAGTPASGTRTVPQWNFQREVLSDALIGVTTTCSLVSFPMLFITRRCISRAKAAPQQSNTSQSGQTDTHGQQDHCRWRGKRRRHDRPAHR